MRGLAVRYRARRREIRECVMHFPISLLIPLGWKRTRTQCVRAVRKCRELRAVSELSLTQQVVSVLKGGSTGAVGES